MTNLRKQANNDLEKTMENEKDWGLPVELISPDGILYNTKKNSTDRLSGQVLYNNLVFDPDTGEEIVVDDPVVTLRLNSLERIPAENETWSVKIPKTPDPEAPLQAFALLPNKAMKFNRSLGFVRMYLSKIVQE